MRELDPERLFERYRATGDPAALAALFDRTAPQLLKVARVLVRDRSLADDLLQATFVTAIEKASWFDGSRRVEPWLVGILAKHAANARRKQNRFLDADRLSHGTTVEPHTDAERREFAAEVERALMGLPAIYRDVLEPRLRHERSGDEIARDLGRAPGVVRVQIARGLEHLRRLLPQGLSVVALGALLSRRSLAAVRNAVVERAIELAPASIATSAAKTAAAVTAGGLVVSKLPVLGIVAALVAVSAWFVLRMDDETTVVAEPRTRAAAESTHDAPSAPVVPATEPARDTVVRDEVAPVLQAKPPATASTWPAVVDPDLAGLTGRLLEADGTPAVDVAVSLLEVDATTWVGVLDALFEGDVPMQIEIATARTGKDGRFVLRGANAAASHALGIDLGGERSTIRVVDRALRSGVLNDIGDLILGRGVALSGTVVDEAGEPLQGARVRVVALPFPVAATGLQHLTSSSVFLRSQGSPGRSDWATMIPPPWLASLIDRLPVPTTSTAADGTFHFTSVPSGSLTVIADHRGFVAATMGPFQSGASGRNVGSIELLRGRAVTGTVVDTLGHPVRDVEVVIGVAPELGGVVVAQRCGRTDAAGRFEAHNVPEFQDVVAAARRSAREAWVTTSPEDVDEVSIELPGTVTLELVVLDARGAPIAAPQFHLRPRQEARLETILLGTEPDLVVKAEAVGNGHHRIDDVMPGNYELTVRSDGFATAMFEVSAAESAKEIELRLAGERTLAARVVAAGDGQPIAGARIAAFAVDRTPSVADAMTRVFTDANGEASLRGLPATADVVLVVDRPGFARIETPVAPDATSFEIAMHRGGSVEGRVLVSGSPSAEPLMIAIVKQRRLVQNILQAPRAALTDARGEFAIQGLPDGEYRLDINERLLSGEPSSWIERFSERTGPLYRASIVVKAGEVTRLDLDLVTRGSSSSVTVHGRVTIDGEPQSDAQVQLTHAQGHAWIELDERGEFTADSLAPGPIEFHLFGVTKTEDGFAYESIFHKQYTVAAGQTENINVDLVSTTIRVHVRTSSGMDAVGASVSLSGADASSKGLSRFGTTDASGTATLRVLGTGSFHVFVEHDEHGVGYVMVELPQSDVDVALDPGVSCAGSFTLGPGVTSNPSMSHHLEFRPTTDAPTTRFRSIMLPSSSTRTFSVAGLGPGEYEVTFRCGPDESAPIAFTLPASGATDLKFVFQRGQ